MSAGRLTFYRHSVWQDFLRSYVIVVDGRDVGHLKRGKALTVDVEDGPHTCRAKISWTGSPDTVITVHAGQEVRVLVGPPNPTTQTLDRALSADRYLALTVDP